MQRAVKRAENHVAHGISQFELTKIVLNNLKHFKLSPTAKLVLLYLTSCYNPKHGEMFPKQKTIATKIGISERSVVRAVQELFKEGLILIECKYTNRYKFTSKITADCAHLSFDNLSDDIEQIDILNRDNLSHHDKEQKKEQKKEQTAIVKENVYKDDDQILYEYAKPRAKQSIDGYIKRLKESGSAVKIISEYKKAKNYTQMAQRRFEETQKLGKIYAEYKNNSVMPEDCTSWVILGKKLGFKK